MNPDVKHITPDIPKTTNWVDFAKDLPDTALQQPGQVEPSYSSQSIKLLELTGTALVRIHSLQPFIALERRMAACGVQLPANVNESLGLDPAAICLAPGEWLLFSEYLGYKRLTAQVQTAAEIDHTVALDLSDSLAVFRLSGAGAPWLLNKLSGMDFHHGMDIAARCATTRMQQLAVTLHYHQPGGFTTESVFDMIIDRSLARYLWQLLIASIPHAEELEHRYGHHP